jgi:hypothetical protein
MNFEELKPDPLGDPNWARLRIISKVTIKSDSSIDDAIEDIRCLLILAAGLHLLDQVPGLSVTSTIKPAWAIAADFQCNRRRESMHSVSLMPESNAEEAILDLVLSCPALLRATYHRVVDGYQEIVVFPRMIVQEVQNIWLTGNGKSAARITDLIRSITAAVSDENDQLIDVDRDHVKRAVAALRRAIFISV